MWNIRFRECEIWLRHVKFGYAKWNTLRVLRKPLLRKPIILKSLTENCYFLYQITYSVVWNKSPQHVLNQLKTDNGGFFPQHGEAIFHIRSEAQDISLFRAAKTNNFNQTAYTEQPVP